MPTPIFRRAVLTAALGALVTPSIPSRAQAPAAQQPAFAPSDPLPFDKAVTRGTLPNGLTYYIRRNSRPEKRVMLQLAVKAGSIDEATSSRLSLIHI